MPSQRDIKESQEKICSLKGDTFKIQVEIEFLVIHHQDIASWQNVKLPSRIEKCLRIPNLPPSK